jgi:hypothetical protein
MKMSVPKRVFASFGRSAALAVVAVMTLSAVEPSAASAASGKPTMSVDCASGSTDISAARRRHYRGGNTAALAAFAGVVGTIGAIAASQERRNYYDGGPGYYGGGPAYYGSPGYGYYGGGYGAPDPYQYNRYSRGGF